MGNSRESPPGRAYRAGAGCACGRVDSLAESDANKPAQVAPVSGGRGNIGGINAAVRELGMDQTEAQRAVKINSMSPAADAAAAGLHDNQSALRAVAREQW